MLQRSEFQTQKKTSHRAQGQKCSICPQRLVRGRVCRAGPCSPSWESCALCSGHQPKGNCRQRGEVMSAAFRGGPSLCRQLTAFCAQSTCMNYTAVFSLNSFRLVFPRCYWNYISSFTWSICKTHCKEQNRKPRGDGVKKC